MRGRGAARRDGPRAWGAPRGGAGAPVRDLLRSAHGSGWVGGWLAGFWRGSGFGFWVFFFRFVHLEWDEARDPACLGMRSRPLVPRGGRRRRGFPRGVGTGARGAPHGGGGQGRGVPFSPSHAAVRGGVGSPLPPGGLGLWAPVGWAGVPLPLRLRGGARGSHGSVPLVPGVGGANAFPPRGARLSSPLPWARSPAGRGSGPRRSRSRGEHRGPG